MKRFIVAAVFPLALVGPVLVTERADAAANTSVCVTPGEFERVSIGMGRQVSRAILDGPGARYEAMSGKGFTTRVYRACHYGFDYGRVYVSYENGKVFQVLSRISKNNDVLPEVYAENHESPDNMVRPNENEVN